MQSALWRNFMEKEKRKYVRQPKLTKEELKQARKRILAHKFCNNVRQRMAELIEPFMNELVQIEDEG